MSFINWRVATAEDLATLNAQLIKTELQRRNLSTIGNKEELIDRLLVDTAEDPPPNHEPAPCVPEISTSFPTMPVPTTSFPAMPAFTSDPAENMQRMAAFLHQNMAIMMTTIASDANPVHVTTLPELSASLPTFNGSGTPTFKHWIEELERIQRLARWEDPTLLAIARRGVAADWHASTGRQLTTWTIWKAGLQEQFGEQLSMIQWQQKVTALTQKAGESLQQYTFAKLKTMSRCPVPITDKERIEYLVQGIRDDQVATSIAVQRPRTVDDFLSIVSEVDRAVDHARLIRSPQPAEHFARQPGRPQLQSATARTDSVVNSAQTARPSTFQQTTSMTLPPRINSLPPADQESRYEAISAKYGAPAYRKGQDLKDAVCYNCQEKGHLAMAGLPVERHLRRRAERDLERLSEGDRELLRESRDLDLDLLACAWCRSPPPSPVFVSGGNEIHRSFEIERLPQPLCRDPVLVEVGVEVVIELSHVNETRA
ncbi:hypothetical protein HPB49_003510 [Dermacentor silvarum]|uniref:Uncharacterized protein n=1 Tax=Dermacentor silvarum TaxID=543639 RepID=A0ACB8DM84_DERSI|nr:hypothetical protein HPB49_003510 [Dermacentor silvarum]